MKKLSLSSQKYRFGIRDPWSGKNLFRIPDPGVKKAPDPGSATLRKFYLFQIRIGRNNVWFWAEAAAAWRRRRYRQIRVWDGSQSQVAPDPGMLVPDPVSGSFIPDPDPNILTISDPGYRRRKGTGSRIQGLKRHRISEEHVQPVINIGKCKKWSHSKENLFKGPHG